MNQERRPIEVGFLGSRPISLKAFDIVVKQMQKRGDQWISLYALTKSDDKPPPGVVEWWDLGSLKQKVASAGVKRLSSEDDLLSLPLDLITMVFHNDIIPQSLISRIPRGITNLHFGYLPSRGYSTKTGSPHKSSQPFSKGTFRGSNVLSHAILQEEEFQAVTFHFISERIDLGNVIEYAWTPINKDTTAWDLQQASEKNALAMYGHYFPILVDAYDTVVTLPPGKEKYPYYNRQSLDPIKVLDPKISDSRLEVIARALSFPNTEPPYFLEKNKKGQLVKRYILYSKSKKQVIEKKPTTRRFVQKLEDIL